MRLYLVRHGDAVSEAEDPQRPLSSLGISEIESIAEILENRRISVEAIWHSTKQRAQQSAEIIRQKIAPQIQLVPKEYLSPSGAVEDLLSEMRGLDRDLMIVGHLPFLPRLMERLIEEQGDKEKVILKTGSVVALEKRDNDWDVIWSEKPSI